MHGQAWVGLLLRAWPSWHPHHSPRRACSAMWKVILRTLTVCLVDMSAGAPPVLSDKPVLQTLWWRVGEGAQEVPFPTLVQYPNHFECQGK